jgi:hypothetical protein
MRKRYKRRLAFAALAMLMVLSLEAFASQYGLTWDESQGDLFFGERYWAYWVERDPAHLDFTQSTIEHFEQPGYIDLNLSPCRALPQMFYPFANTLSAGLHGLLHRALGVLAPIPAYHAVNLVLFAILVWNLACYLDRDLGLAAALGGAVLLLAHPRFIAHLQFNIKDIPTTCLFGLAVLHFATALEKRQATRLILVAVLVGIGTATKANCVFLAVVFLAMLAFDLKPFTRERLDSMSWPFVTALATMPVVALVAYYFAWPQAWGDFLQVWQAHVREVLAQGYREPARGFHFGAWRAVAITTPPVVLVFAALGVAQAARWWVRRVSLRPMLVMFGAWLLVPLVRVTLPGLVDFDGIRHFLEFWPAFAVFAMFGVRFTIVSLRAATARFLEAREPRLSRVLTLAVLLSAGLPPLLASVRTHPYQIAYFNALVGGLGGAQARGEIDATDYWAASYLQGMRWLSVHAERPGLVVVPVASHVAQLYEKLLFPPDLRLLKLTRADRSEVSPKNLRNFRTLVASPDRPPVYVMFVTRESWYNAIVEDTLRGGAEVLRLEVDGGVILRVFRL